jgi:hypothetical protein
MEIANAKLDAANSGDPAVDHGLFLLSLQGGDCRTSVWGRQRRNRAGV